MFKRKAEHERFWKMQQLLYVSGDSYEFSDDTFANDEDKSEEDLDFVATFSWQF